MGKIICLCSRCSKYHEIENQIYTDSGKYNLECPTCWIRLAFKNLSGDLLRDTVKKKLDSHPRSERDAKRVLDGIQSLISADGEQIIDLTEKNKQNWITRLLRKPLWL